jgi:DNA primase
VDLAIATLPEGLDPCDLLVQRGPEPFRAALEGAIDALDFKLNQVLTKAHGIEERRRAVDLVLGVIALAPEMPGQAGAIKRQLIVTRIAQRLILKEENVWARLKEIRARAQGRSRRGAEVDDRVPAIRTAPAAPEERQLLQVLLADASLVPMAADEIPSEQIQHPGLRLLLQGLYDLASAGAPPTLDQLRARLDNPALADTAFDLQEIGRHNTEREAWLRKIVVEFRRKRLLEPKQQEIKNQLHAASDHATALDLLRQLQNPN